MGYVDYEAWEKFSKSEITYITREKKSEVASISAEGSPRHLERCWLKYIENEASNKVTK